MSSEISPLKQPERQPLMDAHIHFEMYEADERTAILQDLREHSIEAMIGVSKDLESCQENLKLAESYPGFLYPAFGYHPEQKVPSEAELKRLLQWIDEHADKMIAVGEIGLPYYSRLEAVEQEQPFDLKPYIQLMETMLQFAKKHDKPVVLHAVYDDADRVCDLLEQYEIKKAHFHWFKGSAATIARMAESGYYVSFTPDILYESEIIELARVYPTNQVMVETDGPWPFEGPFSGLTTHPRMVNDAAAAWASIQGIPLEEARTILYDNTRRFYGLT
ncbi:MAG TPA: TatD family hydrolase [Paenibacillus sp.]|jgi:TatD DNase family protein